MLASLQTEARRVVIGALAFALLFAWPLIPHLGQFGAFHDWEFTTELHWVPYYTVVHYRQLPLWNPFKCGGMPLFANPSSRILTPFFLLHLLVGPILGEQLEIILHLALGWAGGYVLGRTLGVRPLAGAVCASVFVASSWFYLHSAEGHSVFLPAVYLPWIAASYCMSIERKRFVPAAFAGLLTALILYEGGLYIVIFAIILIAALTASRLLCELSLWPLWSAITTALFAAGLAAVKLLPMVAFFRLYPRGRTGGEGNQWWTLGIFLFSHHQDILRVGPGAFGFQEYGAFLSLAFAGIALCGLLYNWRRSLPWVVAGLLFAEVARGDMGYRSLWNYLRTPTPFGEMLTAMRLPARFLIGVVAAVAVLAGLGAEMLCAKMRNWGPRIAIALLGIGVVDSWLVGPPNLKLIFRDSTVVVQAVPHFQQMRQLGAKGNMTHVAMANMGALECYEYTDIRTKAVGYDQPGYRGEQFLADPGTVQLTRWTPNVLTYDLNSSGANRLLVNQNYNEGWRISEGQGQIFSDNGLIGVRIPAGTQRLTLAYHSEPFERGLIIALIASAALFLLWRFDL